MEEVKQIEIKHWTFYFCKKMISLKDFESKLLKIDKNLTEAIFVC